MGKIIEVKSEAEYSKALAEARGQVVVEFIQKDCGFCEDEVPRINKLVEKCPESVTVIRADVDDLPQVAWDGFLGPEGGTPTLYLGTSEQLANMTPEKAKQFELDDSTALKRRLKCGRTEKPKAP